MFYMLFVAQFIADKKIYFLKKTAKYQNKTYFCLIKSSFKLERKPKTRVSTQEKTQ